MGRSKIQRQEVPDMSEVMSLDEAGAAIGKSARTIRRYINDGKIKAFISGERGLVVRRTDVSDLLRPYVPPPQKPKADKQVPNLYRPGQDTRK
jgi:hypothetical protein